MSIEERITQSEADTFREIREEAALLRRYPRLAAFVDEAKAINLIRIIEAFRGRS